MTKKNDSFTYEDVLMQTFGFSEATIEANSAGELTPEQAKVLRDHVQQGIWGFCISAAVFVGALIGSAFGLNGGVALVVLILSAISALYTLWMWYSYGGDSRKNTVESVEGPVNLSLSDSGSGSSSYKMAIGKQKFTINKKKFLAMKNGDPYRIYYLPHSKHILGIEWLYSDLLKESAFVEDPVQETNAPPVMNTTSTGAMSDGEIPTTLASPDESVSLSDLLNQQDQHRSQQR